MFNLQEQKNIPLLDVNAQIYNESEFNCKHIHLESDSNEKVFMVAFRTIPEDSTGVAHILEHTALCGSKKYPVRDPFFMMIRRSLNTFMNAFTSSDWTAYPFATLNKKDFNNLLGVYLDSAFFPNLDNLDFAQEGHRLEFQEKNNPESEIEIKGVVYNEMKGAMSSITSQLWHGMSKHLYSSSTYKHNSGGDPENIIDLSHEDLVNFHQKHYHPSNATFFTFGNIDPQEIQSFIKENVLDNFSPSDEVVAVKNEDRLESPKVVSDFYNPQPGDEKNHHIVLSWLLNESHNPVQLLETYLMSNILLDNSASPLRKVLESSKLGKSPSPLTGLEADQKELVFAAGLEGVDSNKFKEVEKLIMDCLTNLVEDGVPKDLIDSSLHQLEIRQREITGSGMPFGLQIMLTCLPACIHNDNPLNVLDLDTAFNTIKNNLKTDNYIENLIDRSLIKNNHRLTYSLIPDTGLNKKNEEKIQNKVYEITKNFSSDDKEKLIKLAKDLEKRQNSIDDPEVLPKVTKEDIPKTRNYASPITFAKNESTNYVYKSGTNGIVYHSMIFPCEALDKNELEVASLFSNTLTDIGLGKDGYEDIQKYQSSITGGISASFITLPNKSDDTFKLALKVSSKSLEGNESFMQDLILRTVKESSFDETKRIQELLEFISSDNEKSVIQNGHILSMSNAASQISDIASTNDLTSGLRFVHNTNHLSKLVNEQNELTKYLELLRSINSKISNTPSHLFTASALDKANLNLSFTIKENTHQYKNQNLVSLQSNPIGWITGSQVCFCAEAFPTVDFRHEDAPALTVLGTVLRNGYLHSAIREKGGAYGAGATQDSNNKVFKFFSYRDPKCTDTFNEFKKSREWSVKNITEEQLEEGVLGVISSIDKPLSPFGEAMSDFMSSLDQKTQDERLSFRSKVKECSLAKLAMVSEKYLFNESKRSAIAGQNYETELKDLGFEIKNI
ncbi:MAG: Zn-dependent peptidase [Flavobacteriales bacterium]|nr:Zn-dependent peptidase [Flavobacteriales bacterium]